MIPKIIHYCWFGEKDLPKLERRCIKTWKNNLQDYEFMFWNEKTFDVNATEWTKTAYENGKYAFVADYVRLHVLQQYGGIYLDTDVKVLKSFSPLLMQDSFWCFEDAKGSVAASCVIGARKQNPFIADLLRLYNRPFDMSIVTDNIANVIWITKEMQKRGLRLGGTEQVLQDIHIYPNSYFCPMDFWGNWTKTKDTYCVHLFTGSWLSDVKLVEHKKRKSIVYILLKKFWLLVKNVEGMEKVKATVKKYINYK